MQPNQIVSQDEWLIARRTLLAKEKAHMRAGDTLAAERRTLPWLRIEKSYVFDTAGGRRTLAELFDGCGQLIVHHLMFAPEWEAACPGCSFQAEHIDGAARHLEHHDVKCHNLQGPARQDSRLSATHGLELRLGVFLRQRFQL